MSKLVTKDEYLKIVENLKNLTWSRSNIYSDSFTSDVDDIKYDIFMSDDLGTAILHIRDIKSSETLVLRENEILRGFFTDTPLLDLYGSLKYNLITKEELEKEEKKVLSILKKIGIR